MKRFFFFLSLLISVSIGQVWGAEQLAYTLTPVAGSNNSYTGNCDVEISDITWNVTGNASLTPWRLGGKSISNTDREVYSKTAMGNAITKVELTVGTASSVTVNSLKLIVASDASFNNSKVIDEVTKTFAANSTITFTPTSPATEWATGAYYKFVFNITISSTSNKYVQFSEAKFYKEVTTETCEDPTFSPTGGITFYGSQEITISTNTAGASIYYTTDGSTPSSSNGTLYEDPFSIDETTTIKAITIKEGATDSQVAEATYTKGTSVTSFEIDFETNNVAAYVNWDFVNIGIKSAISAHGGTYYGANINGSGNGVTTASITTKEKYANPGILTFFISKESTNTTASSWVVQVSDDGETWTNVGDPFAAQSMSSGTWNECAADLSEYSNVYVRISYGSSGAIRAIDDISLTTASSVAKPTISGDDNFLTSTTVTITQANANAIYYTTNGSDPTTNSIEYTAPFSLTESATVKAIAVKGNDVSAVASKEFTKIAALTTMAEVQAAAESTEKGINVSINNWVVTAVSSNQVWIADADNEKGIILYKSGHGFVAGNKINGTVIGTKIKLYNDYPELTSLVASEVTMTTADAVTPQTKSIADLTNEFPNTQGTVVAFENLTYTSNVFSDGTNTIAVDTRFISNVVTLVNDAVYNVTGVVFYGSNHAIKIMPRSADDVEQVSGGGLPEVDGLAALKAEDTGSSYLVTLTNAVVTFADDKNAFIEDVAAGALIYYQNGGHGLAAGDKLNGQYEVTTATFNGKFEITAMIAQTGAETTHNAEIPVTTLTIAQLNANFAANESRRIKVVGVNVTDAIANNDRNGEISDGTNTIILYAGKNGVEASLNNNIDAIGYPTFYVTNNANQRQLAVWAQSDITVNVKEDPELSYSPESETIEVGDDWTAPELSNEHNLTLSYESSNPDVATVSNTGVIALVENATGSATITASFAGNETYNAGSATYTITVTEASAPLSPWASVYTSNITLDKNANGGSNVSDAKVVYDETEYVALKAGTSSKTGAVVVIVPAGTTKLHFHAYGWSGEDVTLAVTAGVAVTPPSVGIAKNTGVSGSSTTYTLAEGSNPKSDAYYAVTLSDVTEATAVKFTATGGNRFVIFGVNQEGATTPASIAADPTSLAFGSVEQGAEVDAKTINVTLTEVTTATIALSGDGASAFSIDKTALSESGAITVTPNTTTVGTYAATITISDDASKAQAVEVAVSMTVTSSSTPSSSTTYRKVTSTADITTGEYLIVYENGYLAFNGGLEKLDAVGNCVTVTISQGVITGSEEIDAAIFTIDATNKSIQSHHGEFIGQATDANGLTASETADIHKSLSIDADGNFVAESSGGAFLRYNTTSNQTRFRYYKSTSYTNQQAIQLYKKESATPPTPDYGSYQRDELTVGNYGTICLPNAGTIANAKLFDLEYYDGANTLYLLEVNGNAMEAGRPYIFLPSAESIVVTYTDNVGASAGSYNGLVGSLANTNVLVEANAGNYILYNNAYYFVNSTAYVGANRAYIHMAGVPTEPSTPQVGQAPRRRVAMNVNDRQVATGISDIETNEQPVKVMIDGNLYIIRAGQMYDMTGSKVK